MTPKAKQARLKVLRRLVRKNTALALSPDTPAEEKKLYADFADRAKTEISLLNKKNHDSCF